MHLKARAGEDDIKISNYQKALMIRAVNETTKTYKEKLNDHIKRNRTRSIAKQTLNSSIKWNTIL